MMRRAVFLGLLCAVALAQPALGQDICELVAGASVIADDGEFLGKVTNEFDRESIFSDVGRYGSEVSRTSIWNSVSKYGSEVSRLSAFNDMTTTPPALVKRGRVLGYLTTNRSLRGAINPWVLKSCRF